MIKAFFDGKMIVMISIPFALKLMAKGLLPSESSFSSPCVLDTQLKFINRAHCLRILLEIIK